MPQVDDVPRRVRRRIGRPAEVEGHPCACTPDRMCLFHYGQLHSGRRTRERVRAGIHEPYTTRRF